MRTTLTLDDRLAKALKKTAHESGKTLKAVVNETLRAGLAAGRTITKPKPYRVKPVSLGGVRPGIDLNKALRIADQMELQETARTLQPIR
jgi:hypothetical protein